MMRASFSLLLLPVFVAAAPAPARAATPRIAVVGPAGSTLARDVATELSQEGALTELALSPEPTPVPLDAARACVDEGHQLAFRLDFPGALKALAGCADRFAPVLARPHASAVLSNLLSEIAAAAVGAGEAEQAKAAFARLARIPDAVAPDPSIYPPEVITFWQDAKTATAATPPLSIALETQPAWATVYVEGQRLEPGDRAQLPPGRWPASAEAPGFAPWSGVLAVDATTARVAIRMTPLDAEARRAAVRAQAAEIPPAANGAADELVSAFGVPVVVVAATKAPDAVLVVPADRGRGTPAQIAAHLKPVASSNPARAIATAIHAKLAPERDHPIATGPTGPDPVPGPVGPVTPGGIHHTTLYIVGGAVLGVLAVGAGAYALSNSGKQSPGDKNGTVVWQP